MGLAVPKEGNVMTPFSCPQDVTNFQKHMTSHIRKGHVSLEKAFACSVCEKCFSCARTLSNHLTIHIGVKCFGCSTCHKRFRLSTSNLKRHKLSHTGQKLYVCNTCGKGSTTLKTHQRSHTGEKPYFYCGKGFCYRSVLDQHMCTHTGEKPLNCLICGKCCMFKATLEIHMRSHTGERPFKCRNCGKGLMCKNTLIIHMRTHTGERPYASGLQQVLIPLDLFHILCWPEFVKCITFMFVTHLHTIWDQKYWDKFTCALKLLKV
uniref:C2H2-type domain-containing protein n=1 Tax=Oncorhynchus tshawytscha TaxID=74940 RepID=A0AAZ3SHB9_ONCTS